ncbi:MAG: phosphatidylserine synthase [Bacteroidales bacterium]|nr:phosphatidylserine synthase [Bacteroidales bacterium]MBR4676440.1 phosphatidylserine synthase [Bacteroidales bacterium]
MKELDNFAINTLLPYFANDNFKGSQLVELFNKFGGFRDVYDYNNGGLPKLSKKQSQNTPKKDYVRDRLIQMRDKGGDIPSLLESIIIDENIVEQIEKIISPCGYSIENINGEFKILGQITRKKNEIKTDVSFQDNVNKIYSALDKAKVSINIAMAWFTVKILYDKLIEKKNSGVDIKIIINNDFINGKYGIDLTPFNSVKMRGERGGIMHHKFCIIDNQIVITGSYNWTNNAENKNNENIQIIVDDNKLASTYSVEFNRLWRLASKE